MKFEENVSETLEWLENNLELARIEYVHKKRELEKSLNEKLSGEVKLTSENAGLKQQLKDMTENYRTKLMSYLNQDDEDAGQAGMLDELLATYKARESTLVDEAHELRRLNHDIARTNKLVFESYKQLWYKVEDLGPKSGIELPPLNERELSGSGESSSELEARLEREAATLSFCIHKFPVLLPALRQRRIRLLLLLLQLQRLQS